jgi:hypothetical protein
MSEYPLWSSDYGMLFTWMMMIASNFELDV